MKEHPCSAGSGGYPDPTNCSQFFHCSHGTAMITACPGDLIYNSKLKVCDYPRRTPCDSTVSENGKVLHLFNQLNINIIFIKDIKQASFTGSGIFLPFFGVALSEYEY